MSSNFIPPLEIGILVAVIVASLALFGYAIYWAFNIRRALAVRLYRNQALAIGLVAFAWILTFVNNIVFDAIFSYYVPFVIVTALIYVMFYYFIDASVLAGRMSDPLLRDTLHWSRYRYVFWAVNIIAAAISISLVTYFQLTTGTEPPFMIAWGGQLSVYVTLALGIVALPITVLRSRDILLRRHYAWFGGLVAAILLIVDPSRITNNTIGIFVGLTMGAYFLYRSAKSLVLLNRISSLESVSKVEPPPP